MDFTADLIRIHGWIFFALFLHGMLLAYLVRGYVAPVLERDFYACLCVLGFILSLLANVVIGVVASLAGLGLDNVMWVLIALDLALLAAVWRRRGARQGPRHRTYALLWFVVAVCFFLMTANGGLISLLADSWWHMSLANEIVQQQSVFVDRHHLAGTPRESWNFVYEPGWHLNLALVLSFSGLPAPMLWHALAPWCVMVSLLSYYLLALTLSENVRVALLAVVLLALVLGGINAYFRVSPWPGNVSYALMYFALTVVFAVSRRLHWTQDAPSWLRFNSAQPLVRTASEQRALFMLLLVVLATMAMLHLAEVFWVIAAIVAYSLALYLMTGSKTMAIDETLAGDGRLFMGLWLWFFLLWAPLSLWRQPQLAPVIGVVGGALVILVVGARVTAGGGTGRMLIRLCLCAAMLYLFLDFAHLKALFEPQATTTGFYSAYIPRMTAGHFGETLQLPQWEHQLRAGLLLNGLLAVVLSVLLVLRQATRASVFLSATAVFSFIVIASPYVFTFFTGLLPATGVYRFQILILHPIIIACTIAVAVAELKAARRGRGEAA